MLLRIKLMDKTHDIITSALYLLYFSNLYFLAIIMKTVVKELIDKNIQLSFYQCENIIKYMYFVSLVATLFLYGPFQHSIYYMDTIGIAMLSISSYEYHNAVSIQKIGKNVLDDDLIWYYINDVIFIHIRCFMAVVTNVNIYKSFTTMSPDMNIHICQLYMSFLLHSITIYHFVKYIFKIKCANELMEVNEGIPPKYQIINILNAIPILFDSLVVAFSSDNIYSRNNMLFITTSMFICSKVTPLYHMNHLGFHVLLFIQTIFVCQSNIIANSGLEK
jgi:hypothetical protein